MSVDIAIPEVGEGVTEATIVAWLKAPGDGVRAGEIILEIMTDKVNVEVESPASGVLSEILFAADEELRVGTVIGRIDES